MNRIVISPLSGFGWGAELADSFDRPDLGSIYTSNDDQQNRHEVFSRRN